MDLPDGSTTDDFDVDFDDNDDNGVLNVGDVLVVTERGDLFNDGSVPGLYPVRVLRTVVGGDDVVIAQSGYAPPLPVPEAPVLTFVGADAPAVIGDGVDDLFLVTWTDGDAGPFAVADLAVYAYLGGELPLPASGASGNLVLADDENDDGLFGRGDTLLVRETADQALNQETLQSFSPSVFGSVAVPVGFNMSLYAGDIGDITLE